MLETTLRLAHPVIPFITEELWQRVAPLAGRIADDDATSVMVQRYPVTQPERLDPAADRWMSELKVAVDAVRNLRGAMRMSPAQRVPLVAAGRTVEARARLATHAPYLESLARLSGVTIVETLDDAAATAPVQVRERLARFIDTLGELRDQHAHLVG